ncbi:MAG: peptidylprolyl isomerase [Deltaproteobacteria bacterium]|nr:peptidylprolyl isomerase [Deltaproteobacteria bacterium]
MLFRIALLLSLLFQVPAWAESEPPFALPKQEELSKLRSAIIYTSRGDLYFELYPEDAPWHVANFKYLADKGYYKGLKFYLYYPGYIIQGGSPNGKASGGPGYELPPEFTKRLNEIGSLGMARKPDYINPERRSNGSQFHILLGDAPQMDGSYTVFGKLIKGGAVLKNLRKDDTIKDIKVFVRPQ